MRLIDADEVKKALTLWETDPTDEEIEYTIDELPTIDAEPVKHGEWLEIDDGENDYMFCSVCKHEMFFDSDYGYQHFAFCPYCGAKMAKYKD